MEVTVLSLGAGEQSSALACMLDENALPGFKKPDWAIFADTGAEMPNTLETVKWLRSILSYPVITTSWGNLAENTLKALTGKAVPERGHAEGAGFLDIPAFTGKGMAKRQCTYVYKIRPVKAMIRQLAGEKPPKLRAVQYLGISANERRRAVEARDAWITNVYPLVEMNISREDCRAYLDSRFQGHPVSRSACWFCPYMTPREWRQMKAKHPALYEQAENMEALMLAHERGPWQLKKNGLIRWREMEEMQPALGERGDQG